MLEAVDDLEDRLRRQLVHLEDRTRTRHRWTAVATEHEWRHGDLSRRRKAYARRPVDNRELVRRKTFASAPMTVDEAAYAMTCWTTTSSSTGTSTPQVPPWRAGSRAAATRCRGRRRIPGATPGTAVAREPGPPTLTLGEARTRPDADHEPFVFDLDAATGEGRVIYVRYDGQYGLVAEQPVRGQHTAAQ